MPGLRLRVVWIRRAGIQAAQLAGGPDDVLHALEDRRHRDQLGEYAALVDEVGQSPRAGLVAKLGSGLFAFLRPQRFYAFAQFGKHRRRNEAGENEVPQFVQLPSFGCLQHELTLLYFLSMGCVRLKTPRVARATLRRGASRAPARIPRYTIPRMRCAPGARARSSEGPCTSRRSGRSEGRPCAVRC